MHYLPAGQFSLDLHDYVQELWAVLWPGLPERWPGLEYAVVFGSYGRGSATESSDLDLALLFNQPVSHAKVKQAVLDSLPAYLHDRLSLFAWDTATFVKLYHWKNSVAHGIMSGKLVYSRSDPQHFLEQCRAMQRQTAMFVRRYE